MYPQQNQQFPSKFKWLILIGFISILLILLIIVFSRVSFQERRMHPTPLTASINHGYLIDDAVFFYDGASFQKINSQTGEKEVLATGIKLPNPAHIYWSPEGALLNFDSSFLLTEVQSKLENIDKELDERTRKYTWYLDFSSDELSLVDSLPVNPRWASYSENDSGFYYATSEVNQESRSLTSALKFFNTESLKNSVLVESLELVDISYIGSCTDYKVCLIARHNDDIGSERLYAFDEEDKLKEIFDSKGRLFTTNRPYQFLVVSQDTQSSDGEDIPEEVIYSEEPSSLVNIKNNTSQALGFDVGNAEIILGFIDEDEYFVLDDQIDENVTSEGTYYRAGTLNGWLGRPTNRVLPLLLNEEGTLFTDKLTTRVSFGAEGDLLVSSFSGNQYLFSEKQEINGFTELNESEVSKNIEVCGASSNMSSFDYLRTSKLFKIYFENNSQFTENIMGFGKCISSTNTLGYNLYFGGLDPRNSRIVTD